MRDKLKKRIASAVCAAAMMLSSLGQTFAFTVTAEAPEDVSAPAAAEAEQEPEKELVRQSFELYPGGEDSGQVITLEGLMPEGAEAEAVDVSDDYEGIAAYDITISDGSADYQPGEDNPVFVEISDPVIPESGSIELWHIKDSGEREQIFDFTVSDGKLSFYASGFSVYEIVVDEDIKPSTDTLYDSIAKYGSDGFDVSYVASKKPNASSNPDRGGPFYFTNEIVAVNGHQGRTGIKSLKANDSTGAVKIYFESSSEGNDRFYVYFKDTEGNKQYLEMFYDFPSHNSYTRSALRFAASDSEKTLFTIEKNPNSNQIAIYATNDGKKYYWNRNGNTVNSTSQVVGYYSTSPDLDPGTTWLTLDIPVEDDPYKLDGKTYGLMSYTSGTHGYALMADDNVHSLIELVTHKHSVAEDSTVLYVDEGSEISRWTFHTKGGDSYTLSAETDEGVKYLTISGGDIAFTSTEADAASFKVTPDSNGRLQLSADDKYLVFSMQGEGDNITYDFSLASTAEGSWLTPLRFAKLADDDLITYSANRISVSDAVDGQKVIIYTRLWDEENKKYDIYAVDCDGSLYPCYASGGKIMWLGDGVGTLEWILTVYRDPVTKEPNNYYELFNPYSEKYIAPQLSGNQVLSDSTLGINLPKRRYGEFYSEIVAWDNPRYTYIGLRPTADKKRLEPCADSVSVPFYFASLEPLNLSGELHTVPTINNDDHGITMRMFNFGVPDKPNSTEKSKTSVTVDYFNGNTDNKQGLLETNLTYSDESDAGYPTVKSTNRSFKDMYADAVKVNNLFIESIYNSSGYFEFDSCQNFAELNQETGNFTVYRELGTTNYDDRATLKHGQFYPYNTISPVASPSYNPYNLYNMDALASNTSVGKLDETDPRKYEKLHLIKDPDYFFGMEMSASFVQTVSGLDAWGHDIIFDFTGDDDFWLYVDGELVIDLGGTHSAEHGRVNFRTGEITYSLVNSNNTSRTETTTTLIDVFRKNLTDRGEENVEEKLSEIFDTNSKGQYIFKDYTEHTMRVFYMERGAGASNLHMRFNIASVTPGHVVVSKGLSGDGADSIDKDFVEYPFQIYYTLPDEDGNEGAEQLLANDYSNIMVTYQNSNQPVTFVKKYRPPGFSDEDAYENIYFINPSKNAEICFPDNTISYRIVECAVDNTVYDQVYINGVAVQGTEIKGTLRNYSSDTVTAEDRPTISFDNHVNDDVIKDLMVTKLLYDENEQIITDDPATFDFRLYISSVKVAGSEIPAANMYNYLVLAPGKKICRYDPVSGGFASTDITYSRDFVRALSAYYDDDESNDSTWEKYNEDYNTDISAAGVEPIDIIFTTSPFGAISKIPSNYTVCVPGLPVGSVFKVTEDVKTGYGLIGYKHVLGTKVYSDTDIREINSYNEYEPGQINVGEVIADENPQLEVHNKKGYGLTVQKNWSDLDITTYHEPVYVAVYADDELLEDSVHEIASPATSTYYFWTTLKNNRETLEGYVVKEVTIEGDKTVNPDGTVTGFDADKVTPLSSGTGVKLSATRTAEATPESETPDGTFEYVVSYSAGSNDSATRTDTITNTRKDGLALRLFKWNSTVPLEGGKFTLTDSSGNTVGTYTSSDDGTISILYNFTRNSVYTLTQASAPNGYVGLDKKLCFKVLNDDSVVLLHEDGTSEWGSLDPSDIGWVGSKPGENGITAFVDVYNKQFNFKIIKTDNEDSGLKLDQAHFALYKQVNTTINGYVKNKFPMTGFEDMTTVDGEVDICGGSSGRIINPGTSGGIYFLTEIEAPPDYSELKDDIVFRISPLGIPSLITNSYDGVLEETEDAFIYTLSVPNVKKQDTFTLTVEKKIQGSLGDKEKDFTFHLTVEGAEADAEYEWTKNGVTQTPLTPGGTFTMRHNDKVEIILPAEAAITLSEDNEGYTTTFAFGSDPAESVTSKTFTLSEPTELVVTNSLNTTVPTGLSNTLPAAAALLLVPLVPICAIIFVKRRRKQLNNRST